MRNKKLFQSVTTILFCATAIWVGLNVNIVKVLVWRLWYGHHLSWHGINVELNDPEYFLPMPKNEGELFISDWKSQNANIVLHPSGRTSAHQKAFVADFCRSGECRQAREQSYIVSGRRVDQVSFIKLYPGADIQIFHQYTVIEGGEAWIEFFGDETRYVAHKPTIDSLIRKIAK